MVCRLFGFDDKTIKTTKFSLSKSYLNVSSAILGPLKLCGVNQHLLFALWNDGVVYKCCGGFFAQRANNAGIFLLLFWTRCRINRHVSYWVGLSICQYNNGFVQRSISVWYAQLATICHLWILFLKNNTTFCDFIRTSRSKAFMFEAQC